jgi:hypothetical protein
MPGKALLSRNFILEPQASMVECHDNIDFPYTQELFVKSGD